MLKFKVINRSYRSVKLANNSLLVAICSIFVLVTFISLGSKSYHSAPIDTNWEIVYENAHIIGIYFLILLVLMSPIFLGWMYKATLIMDKSSFEIIRKGKTEKYDVQNIKFLKMNESFDGNIDIEIRYFPNRQIVVKQIYKSTAYKKTEELSELLEIWRNQGVNIEINGRKFE